MSCDEQILASYKVRDIDKSTTASGDSEDHGVFFLFCFCFVLFCFFNIVEVTYLSVSLVYLPEIICFYEYQKHASLLYKCSSLLPFNIVVFQHGI